MLVLHLWTHIKLNRVACLTFIEACCSCLQCCVGKCVANRHVSEGAVWD